MYQVNKATMHSSSAERCKMFIIIRGQHTCMFHLLDAHALIGSTLDVGHYVSPSRVALGRQFDSLIYQITYSILSTI
jgi:hypothetical protein